MYVQIMCDICVPILQVSRDVTSVSRRTKETSIQCHLANNCTGNPYAALGLCGQFTPPIGVVSFVNIDWLLVSV